MATLTKIIILWFLSWYIYVVLKWHINQYSMSRFKNADFNSTLLYVIALELIHRVLRLQAALTPIDFQTNGRTLLSFTHSFGNSLLSDNLLKVTRPRIFLCQPCDHWLKLPPIEWTAVGQNSLTICNACLMVRQVEKNEQTQTDWKNHCEIWNRRLNPSLTLIASWTNVSSGTMQAILDRCKGALTIAILFLTQQLITLLIFIWWSCCRCSAYLQATIFLGTHNYSNKLSQMVIQHSRGE